MSIPEVTAIMPTDNPVPSFCPSFIGSPDLTEERTDLRKSVLARLLSCQPLFTSPHKSFMWLKPSLIFLKLNFASFLMLVIGCFAKSIATPNKSSAYFAAAFNLSNLSIARIFRVSVKL